MRLPSEAAVLPQRLLDGARLLPNRIEMLPLLPRHAIFAEVGVGTGGFSRLVLSICKPSLFVAIDQFRLHELQTLWGQPTDQVFGGRTHAQAYGADFAEAIAAGRMRVLEGESDECLARLEDASIDVIYLDADHRYEFVRRDLAVARRKVREDGWIIVNDYLMVAELEASIAYGVVHATNEFMLEHDWGMQYFALQPRMFCDVALRPSRLLHDASAENQSLRDEIGLLRGSTSWRLTAPLRAAARMVIGGRNPR